jgi:hypothetical protein
MLRLVRKTGFALPISLKGDAANAYNLLLAGEETLPYGGPTCSDERKSTLLKIVAE